MIGSIKLGAKGYIQAQEDREDFFNPELAGATKFNKWMKKAGLFFNKQTGQLDLLKMLRPIYA